MAILPCIVCRYTCIINCGARYAGIGNLPPKVFNLSLLFFNQNPAAIFLLFQILFLFFPLFLCIFQLFLFFFVGVHANCLFLPLCNSFLIFYYFELLFFVLLKLLLFLLELLLLLLTLELQSFEHLLIFSTELLKSLLFNFYGLARKGKFLSDYFKLCWLYSNSCSNVYELSRLLSL